MGRGLPDDDIRTLAELVRHHAQRRPEAVAIRALAEDGAGQDVHRFASLHDAACRVANGLRAAELPAARDGTAPRVAYLGKDRLPAFEVLFGVALAGMVMVGLNWRLAGSEVEFILEDGEVGLLFVDAEFESMGRRLSTSLPDLRVIVVGGVVGSAAGGVVGSVEEAEDHDADDYDKWLAAQPSEDPCVAVGPEDPAAQMYTSGTTGLPKGVVLAHRSFFAVVRSMRAHGDGWIGWGPEDVSLSGIPLFHIGGIWWVATTLSFGSELVVLPTFSGPDAWRALTQSGVTKACFVPAMLQVLLGEARAGEVGAGEADVSALETVVYGGSPIPKPFLQEALRVLGCGFAQIYGLTETGNTAVCLRPGDHDRDDLLQAAGRPYPGVRVKVVDPAGRELPPGAVGEICLHSPANMLGYWNRPEATAETLRDGWVHTGDAGHVDDDGYVFVSDRLKDMVLYAGENVYPAEIESVLCQHPGVSEAAVIGIPNDRWGELVTAIVVRRSGIEVSETELRELCAEHLADFKVPRQVLWSEGLPRTPSGKIQKARLRAPFWEGRDRGVN